MLNSVVFPDEIYRLLNERAKHSLDETEAQAVVDLERQGQEAMQRNHAQQMARLIDKYEKKLLGLQKKYTQDVEGLKKQITNLQRKFNAT